MDDPSDSSACKQNTQPGSRKPPISSCVWPRETHRSRRPAARAAEERRPGGLVVTDDGDILCHPILAPSYLQEFVANAKFGVERNPQKTEVIFFVNDLDAAPLEWRIRDVHNIAKVSTVTARSITIGVAVGPRQFILDRLLAKVDVIRAMHERVQLSMGAELPNETSRLDGGRGDHHHADSETQQHQMTAMTSRPSPLNRSHLYSHQAFDCLGSACLVPPCDDFSG